MAVVEGARMASESSTVDVEAVVIGAGFAGLRQLYDLRQRGISARCFDEAPEIGGVWHWNRYPGARTDSQSWIYAYSFSEDLQNEWTWNERYTPQREIHAYLKHVADKFGFRDQITLNTRVESAVFDETRNVWVVTTNTGETVTARYVVSATGPLSAAYKPDFKGVDDFRGEWYMTARWPEEDPDLTGKRVAVIGTGATGVQLIPTIAHIASEVTVFQRTPNYVVPARNAPLHPAEQESIRSRYPSIWEQARDQVFGFDLALAGRTFEDVTPEEMQLILDRGWEIGGFHFVFETFDDVFTDERTNDVISEFIRNKIRTIVKDPETAELLCPKDYPFCGKRPPLGHFYYETYNRENVSLVDVSQTPISEITETGVKVGDDVYEADVIIFATGFDAATGSITRMDIRGRNGLSIAEKWEDGPSTYLGVAVPDFPNFFMIFGPHSPFANAPVVIEDASEWIAETIATMRGRNLTVSEACPDASAAWGNSLLEILNATVVAKGRNNYFLGDNIPGKAHAPFFYLGGVKGYRDALLEESANGYPGLVMN
ncbi:NAD(P)/FAD-dependent oxidoreductase [Dietzia sp. B32]|uniref:flavin-containing monooxygenase n=1 Tax=Dietzia sp. B32 TaxID=2915130 RepID=UPI0021ADF715|nr:NAD(P)/FAD-dependent oxidoreductase [Dietzia sp. B32]UVE93834.1 NAD(P)/FAD-dependent oxidoreductase [Dietzia sp. B32]